MSHELYALTQQVLLAQKEFAAMRRLCTAFSAAWEVMRDQAPLDPEHPGQVMQNLRALSHVGGQVEKAKSLGLIDPELCCSEALVSPALRAKPKKETPR